MWCASKEITHQFILKAWWSDSKYAKWFNNVPSLSPQPHPPPPFFSATSLCMTRAIGWKISLRLPLTQITPLHPVENLNAVNFYVNYISWQHSFVVWKDSQAGMSCFDVLMRKCNFWQSIFLTARYRGALVFLGYYKAIYGFGARLAPFYVASVLLIVFVLFCKFSFSIFYFVTSSDLYVLE